MHGIDYERLLKETPLAWALHSNGIIRDLNEAAARMFGLPDVESGLGEQLLDFVHPDSRAAVVERLGAMAGIGDPGRAVPRRMAARDGHELWVETVASPATHAGGEAVLVLCWDVTERVLAEAALRHAATHDELTGLPNRTLLRERYDLARLAAGDGPGQPAMLFCDMDGFKQVNDVHGHETGDLVLQRVGTRLLGLVGEDCTVARLGGDEFVLLLHGVHAGGLALDLVPTIEGLVPAGLLPEHPCTPVGLTAGVAIGEDSDVSMDDLLRRSDRAMYLRKVDRRAVAVATTV